MPYDNLQKKWSSKRTPHKISLKNFYLTIFISFNKYPAPAYLSMMKRI